MLTGPAVLHETNVLTWPPTIVTGAACRPLEVCMVTVPMGPDVPVATFAGFTENTAHTQGAMMFTDSATHATATVTLLGNYTSTLFHPVTNTTGTFVTYG